jgi:flagellar motor switch protein FliN/FliY
MSRNPIDLFVEALPAAVAQAFAGKASAPWTVTVDEKPQPFPASTQLLTMLLVAEPSKAEAAIQISEESALSLASALGGTATVPGEYQPGHAQTVRAIFAAACEKAVEVLPGTQLHLRVAKTVEWSPAKQISLTATDGASRRIQFQLLFIADWPLSTLGAGTAPSQSSHIGAGINVSVLENVEIDVTLQFGETQLTLHQIGELRSGSVIQLDKYLQDPAELLLGDRVVARGEVVIVDGNYGLRVTEVV